MMDVKQELVESGTVRGRRVRDPQALLRRIALLATRAANLGRDTLAHAIDGFVKVDEPTYQTRLASCQTCETYYKDNRCTHPSCGCTMAGGSDWFAALRWASKQCPIGRWSRG